VAEITQLVTVGLGELLWDCFPDRRRPGGAPANVAYGAAQFGLQSVICSQVGSDRLGDELIEFLQSKNLETEYVARDPAHETGRVDIEIGGDGEPSYTFNVDNAWDNLEMTPQVESLMRSAAAICFGTLAQRSRPSREMIHQCLAASPEACLKVYDVNLRKPWYDRDWIERSLRAANILKLNQHEIRVLGELLQLGTGEPEPFAVEVCNQFQLDTVCMTRGKRGCLLWDSEGAAEHGGYQVNSGDPVGAGDAFSAGLIYATLQQWPKQATADLANLLPPTSPASPARCRTWSKTRWPK